VTGRVKADYEANLLGRSFSNRSKLAIGAPLGGTPARRQVEIDHGRRIEREDLAQGEAAYHGIAKRLAEFGSGPVAEQSLASLQASLLPSSSGSAGTEVFVSWIASTRQPQPDRGTAVVLLHKGADHTTITMHDQPARTFEAVGRCVIA
jgi:hypothetical protein